MLSLCIGVLPGLQDLYILIDLEKGLNSRLGAS
jgi:hypothetical protein